MSLREKYDHGQVIALPKTELTIRRLVGKFTHVAYNELSGVPKEKARVIVRVIRRNK